MDNSDLKDAKTLYSAESYQAYLQLEFNKEGKEKLREISNKYQAVTDEAGNETIKNISITLDGQTLITTYFGDEIADGILQISVGDATQDFEQYEKTINSLENIVTIMSLGKMPVKYQFNSSKFIQSEITEDYMNISKIVFAVIILIVSVVLLVLYKSNGLLASITGIGYIGVLTLIIRYTNVSITINSIVAFIVCIMINYVFIIDMLNRLKNKENGIFIESMKGIYIKLIPVIIIALVFTFMPNTIINSIGMMLFWGMMIQALYNTIFTKFILN